MKVFVLFQELVDSLSLVSMSCTVVSFWFVMMHQAAYFRVLSVLLLFLLHHQHRHLKKAI